MGISRAEALDSLRSDDLIGLGMEADSVRRRLHPEGVVSYAVMFRLACAGGSTDALRRTAERMFERGATGVSLGGVTGLGVSGVLDLVAGLRRLSPGVWIAGPAVDELRDLAASSGGDVDDLLGRLREAGWDSLSAEGPDPADRGAGVAEWLRMHEAAHRLGVRTVATLQFGAGESAESRIDFLHAVRDLQERTSGFAALVTESAGGGLSGPTAVECLKTLAVSRLMVDTIENVQLGSMASGLKVLEMGLRFGANDAGEVPLAASGGAGSSYEEDLRRVIRDAGFMPVERDPGYRMMFAG